MALPQDSLTAYRAKVRKLYAPEFKLHLDLAAEVEHALVAPRTHSTDPDLVLDMLQVQAFKAHLGVLLLCEHGLVEDAATLARRLLELSIQAIYIAGDDQEDVRRQRAGKYLTFMWRHFPRRMKQRLPPTVRDDWSRIARRHGRLIRPTAKSWGPDWKTMFQAVGLERLYQNDYAFLSAVAHGRPDDLIITFSRAPIRVYGHEHVPVLLVYSSRYYVAVVEQWDRQFKALEPGAIERMAQRLAEWRLRPSIASRHPRSGAA